MALNYPQQGEWTEEEYLSLNSNRLIEFTDGVLEFLPMPKFSHVRLSRYLSDLLRTHVTSRNLGDVFWAPMSVRIGPGRFREPDVVYLSHARIPKEDVPPDGADLVIEIVSGGSQHRHRDLHEKRADYAQAGIPEYWIVDPETETITVLMLPEGAAEYREHGAFRSRQQATSILLPGFSIDVSECMAAGRGETT
jgi:Uma2 family endonuclease